MPKHSKSNENDFLAWLDNHLAEQQSQTFEENIQEDEQLKARLATARFIEQQVHCYEEEAVPNWLREATFVSDKTPWWQWSGLPITSMLCSVFAIALILFKVELQVQENGFLVSFARQQASGLVNAQIEQVVDRRLRDFANEQELVMANLRIDVKDQQQSNNLQLASYLMSTARAERKQDISDFISYINEERKDAEFDQKLRFDQLEYALKVQQQASPLQKVTHTVNGLEN